GVWRGRGAERRGTYPPVDTNTFTPGGERTEQPTVVCDDAASEPRKRVPLLVAAMATVRREHPQARLLLDARTAAGIAGPGVELVDMDDRAALVDLYRRAWVSALPAWGEAFGLVLAEALACGPPGGG